MTLYPPSSPSFCLDNVYYLNNVTLNNEYFYCSKIFANKCIYLLNNSVILPCDDDKLECLSNVSIRSRFNPLFKFPLYPVCRWALWYFKNDKSKSWTENLRLISKFDTVEDFWA